MSRSRGHYGDKGFSRGGVTPVHTLKELREIGDNAVKAAKEALKQGVAVIVADAKSRCPVRSGKLRDSIKATAKNGGTSYTLSANAYSESSKGKYYYGGRVEFDESIGGIPGDGRFLYPAIDAHRAEIAQNIRDAIRNAITNGG